MRKCKIRKLVWKVKLGVKPEEQCKCTEKELGSSWIDEPVKGNVKSGVHTGGTHER